MWRGVVDDVARPCHGFTPQPTVIRRRRTRRRRRRRCFTLGFGRELGAPSLVFAPLFVQRALRRLVAHSRRALLRLRRGGGCASRSVAAAAVLATAVVAAAAEALSCVLLFLSLPLRHPLAHVTAISFLFLVPAVRLGEVPSIHTTTIKAAALTLVCFNPFTTNKKPPRISLLGQTLS